MGLSFFVSVLLVVYAIHILCVLMELCVDIFEGLELTNPFVLIEFALFFIVDTGLQNEYFQVFKSAVSGFCENAEPNQNFPDGFLCPNDACLSGFLKVHLFDQHRYNRVFYSVLHISHLPSRLS